MDHWTPILSEDGSSEVLREQTSREAETPQRLTVLSRVRDAVRILGRQDSQGTIRAPDPRARR